MEKTKALFYINKAWARTTAIEFLAPKSASAVAVVALPVVEYSLADPVFAEMRFYAPGLGDRWIRLFIPKKEVLVILEPQELAGADMTGFMPAGQG